MVRDGKYLRNNKAYRKGWYHSSAYNADDNESDHTASVIVFSKYYKNSAFVRGYFKVAKHGNAFSSKRAMKHSMYALREHYGEMRI